MPDRRLQILPQEVTVYHAADTQDHLLSNASSCVEPRAWYATRVPSNNDIPFSLLIILRVA